MSHPYFSPFFHRTSLGATGATGTTGAIRAIGLLSVCALLLTGCASRTATAEHAQGLFGLVAEHIPEHPLVQYAGFISEHESIASDKVIELTFDIDAGLLGFELTGANMLSGGAIIELDSTYHSGQHTHEISLELGIDGIVSHNQNTSLRLEATGQLIQTTDDLYVHLDTFEFDQVGRKLESVHLRALLLRSQLQRWIHREIPADRKKNANRNANKNTNKNGKNNINESQKNTTFTSVAGYLDPSRRVDRINTNMIKSRVVPDLHQGRYITTEGDDLRLEDTLTPSGETIDLTLIPEGISAAYISTDDGIYTIAASSKEPYFVSFDGDWSVASSRRRADTTLSGHISFPTGIDIDISSTTSLTNHTFSRASLPEQWVEGKEILKG